MKLFFLLFIIGNFTTTHAAINGYAYKGAHAINKVISLGLSHCYRPYRSLKPLAPFCEVFAQSVVKDLNIENPITFYQLPRELKKIGAHSFGDMVFLDADELDDLLKTDSNSARFIIAHELIHCQNLHLLQKIVAEFLGTLGVIYLTFKVTDIFFGTSAADKDDPHKDRYKNAVKVLTSIFWYVIVHSAARCFHRLQEYEADCEAVKSLSKKYGWENASQGAINLFSQYVSRTPTFLQKLFSTHPTHDERVAQILSLKDEVKSSSL